MVDRLTPAKFADLKDFDADNQLEALRHMGDVLELQLKRTPALGPASLSAQQVAAWAVVAEKAKSPQTDATARAFFESHFDVWRVVDDNRPQGLFTGYFEPELKGSRTQGKTFPHPVYAKPRDLVAFEGLDKSRSGAGYGKWMEGKPVAYDSREDIDRGSLQGRADVICFVSGPVDFFFMQVQGSGRVTLDTGATLRLGYAAKSGRSYQSIGAILVREGLMVREEVSMQSIKQWLKDNPERRDWLLWQNPSYVFFKELTLPDVKRGSLGAAGIQLIPQRSFAIDKSRYAYGTPVWLDTTLPGGKTFRRLMIAADTGSAILGAARGDVYFGWGEEAEYFAGHMQQPGVMHVLLPKRS